jgi:Uma2 family endonuclease
VSAQARLPVILESGDRLSRAEFHRRYCARPDIKRAELVEGIVYVASPVRFRMHGRPHGHVIGWLSLYCARHPSVQLGDNATVILDERNEVQPDAFLLRVDEGTARVSEADYIEGAPQLIVEVAASSATYDLHDKLEAYRRNGVPEYIVWRVVDNMIDWFELKDGQYVWVEPDEYGIVESRQFPGLRLNIPKMLTGDFAGVLAELDRTTG